MSPGTREYRGESIMADRGHRGRVLGVVLLALLAPLAATGQEEGGARPQAGGGEPRSEILDRAGLFGKSRVEEVTRRLRTAERESGMPVLIETIDRLDGNSINEEALARAGKSGRRGLYLLISRADKAISRPFVTREFADRYPASRREAIQQTLIQAFRRGEFDSGLVAACDAILRADAKEAGRQEQEAVEAEAPAQGDQDSPLIQRGRIDLTLAGAAQIIEAAQQKARAMDLKVNIAVVDDGGHLIAFARMDGARPASGYTAITKATTAATFRQATGPVGRDAAAPDVWLNLSLQLAASASGGKLTTLYGGVPVVVEGQIIGAVGVGGGSGEQDAEVARAGIESLLEDLGMSPVEKP
jgi:glc operon protein GlcG